MKLRKNIALSDSGFLFDPETGDSYSLNEIGMEIMDLLKQGKGLEEITSRITAEYDIDDTSFEKYYYDFIHSLEHFQLLEKE